jgi:hypothetical protein
MNLILLITKRGRKMSAPKESTEFGKAASKGASWVIVKRGTNEAVVEIFDERILSLINHEKYEIIPIHDYLTYINKSFKG